MNSIYCNPAINSWSELISSNISSFGLSSNLASIREQIRAEVLNCAINFTNELNDISNKIGFESHNLTSTINQQLSLVMTGHQPVLYHSGIFAKNYIIENYLSKNEAIGLNVIIDTDEAELISLPVPRIKNDEPYIDKVTLSNKAGVYFKQQLASRAVLSHIASDLLNAIKETGYNSVYEKVVKFSSLLPNLSDMPISNGMTVLRRLLSSSHHTLEVPLSRIVKLPSIVNWITELLTDSIRLVELYNSTLDEFRFENKIKNAANPFPNLRGDGVRCELPFWVVSVLTGERLPLYIDTVSGVCVASFSSSESITWSVNQIRTILLEEKERYIVVPKASLITLLLRYYISDFFIHGKGGAKYDQFTDQFAIKYIGIKPPNFAVVSDDRYLFSREIDKYEAQQNRIKEKREMSFHIERFLERDEFTSEQKIKLQDLANQKLIRVEKIKIGQEKRESTGELTREVKSIEKQIREIIEAALPTPEQKSYSKKLLDVIYFREFPFFFFY